MNIWMSKRERDNVDAMVRGMSPLPKVFGMILMALIGVGLFFACYWASSATRGEQFANFEQGSIMTALLVELAVLLLARHHLDRATLKATGQYNEAALARGRRIPKLGLKDRAKQFIPTLASWRWLLLAWVAVNALDCISTYLALHYGAQEANPSARAADNMYLSKWIGVAVLTAAAVWWQWGKAMKFLTVMMVLVALSNFAVLGMYVVQPTLAGDYPDMGTPAFLIQLAEMAVIAALILWGREILDAIRRLPEKLKGGLRWS